MREIDLFPGTGLPDTKDKTPNDVTDDVKLHKLTRAAKVVSWISVVFSFSTGVAAIGESCFGVTLS